MHYKLRRFRKLSMRVSLLCQTHRNSPTNSASRAMGHKSRGFHELDSTPENAITGAFMCIYDSHEVR